MDTTLRTYSPTSTDAFAFCPRYWGFYRHRLKPKYIAYPEIASIVGTATAYGLETFYKARRDAIVPDPHIILEAGRLAANQAKSDALANGLRYVAAANQTDWDTIEASVALCLSTHAKHDPFKDYTVVAVEEEGEDRERPDLVVKDAAGLLVVDFKTKLKLRAEWVKKELMKWSRSWQLHHYAIRWHSTRFAVALIAPQTRQGVYYEITPVNPAYAELWKRDAAQLWNEMNFSHDVSLYDLRGNTSHANEYGECVYWNEACSVGMDQAVVESNLVQIERTDHARDTRQ